MDNILSEVLNSLSECRVLVVGDLMLDHYIWGHVTRISPEAPVPILDVVADSDILGGASNVANNLKTLGTEVGICGVIGNDSTGQKLSDLLREQGIKRHLIKVNRPTTKKTRVLTGKQQLVRIDCEETTPLKPEHYQYLAEEIEGMIDDYDAVIIEDYAKGVISADFLKLLMPICLSNKKIVTIDPKQDFRDLYKGATVITPNRSEAESLTNLSTVKDGIENVGNTLLEISGCQNAVITLGSQGMVLFKNFDPDYKPLYIPSRFREVYDVSGAGDTVIAVLTCSLVVGADIEQATMISNIAAGLAVEKLGTSTVSSKEIKERINSID